MDIDEAVEDAIETSKMQGGNLFFIMKKNVESDGRHKILHHDRRPMQLHWRHTAPRPRHLRFFFVNKRF